MERCILQSYTSNALIENQVRVRVRVRVGVSVRVSIGVRDGVLARIGMVREEVSIATSSDEARLTLTLTP